MISRASTRSHPSRWSFFVHRLSGIALALFLPIHFLVLGQAIQGSAALDRVLAVTDHPLFKFGEWGLVVLLSLHLFGGVRVLLIEFGPWRGLRRGWIAGGVACSLLAGLAFLLGLVR
jgi:succinate dehydrogenase subunit D